MNFALFFRILLPYFRPRFIYNYLLIVKRSLLIMLLLLSLFAGGCASSYHTVNPRTIPLNQVPNREGIDFAYRFDVLRQSGNKKYAKKEDKKAVRLIAVKISNYTGYALNVQEDLQLYSGNKVVYPLDPVMIHQQLKQSVPSYLFYMLFSFMTFETTTSTGEHSSTPIGLLLGPGLTGLNMGIAASANARFKEELMHYNLFTTTIEDGETVYGLIGIRDDGYAPLDMRLK
jgi:hypothetical protein